MVLFVSQLLLQYPFEAPCLAKFFGQICYSLKSSIFILLGDAQGTSNLRLPASNEISVIVHIPFVPLL